MCYNADNHMSYDQRIVIYDIMQCLVVYGRLKRGVKKVTVEKKYWLDSLLQITFICSPWTRWWVIMRHNEHETNARICKRWKRFGENVADRLAWLAFVCWSGFGISTNMFFSSSAFGRCLRCHVRAPVRKWGVQAFSECRRVKQANKLLWRLQLH